MPGAAEREGNSMAQYELPKDFFFGAAMSGPQTEGQWNQGGKLENLWDTWSMEDLGAFYNRVGSYGGNDFMAKYKDDLALLKSLGLDTYRTSIQWSRFVDANGEINPEGAAWYHELFRASRKAGLEPFVNLYHFDMPPTSSVVAAGRAARSSRPTPTTPTSPSASSARRSSTGSRSTSPSSSPSSATRRVSGIRSCTTSTVHAPSSTTFRSPTRSPSRTIAAPMTKASSAATPRSE